MTKRLYGRSETLTTTTISKKFNELNEKRKEKHTRRVPKHHWKPQYHRYDNALDCELPITMARQHTTPSERGRKDGKDGQALQPSSPTAKQGGLYA